MRATFQTTLTAVLFIFYLVGAGVGPVLAADGGITYEAGPQLNTARMAHAAVALPDGRVALFGGHGTGFVPLSSAEIWSPATNSFTSYTMLYAHDLFAIAKLNNGSYLLAGGTSSSSGVGYTDTAEVFNPSDNSFTATGKMSYPRTNDAAATLTSGKVLVVGSWYNSTYASYADLYDPAANTFSATGALNTARAHPLVLPTSDGKAVVCGGTDPYGGSYIEQVELYDPATNSFSVLQDNLLYPETGWYTLGGPSWTNGRSVDTQKSPDGRYIFMAYKNGSYAVVAFDPTTKTFTKLNTCTQVSTAENGTVSFQWAPVVNSALNQAYLLAINTVSWGTLPTLTQLFTESLVGGGSCQDISGTTAVNYYFGYMGANLLQDGRLFFTGGTADPSATNFSPTTATFFGTTGSLWQEATPTGGDWYYLNPFGFFNTSASSWIYHQTLGWLYPVGTSTDSIWFYDPQWDGTGGWWWSSSSLFPWLYSVTAQEWLYYDANAAGGRWFFTGGGQASTH